MNRKRSSPKRASPSKRKSPIKNTPSVKAAELTVGSKRKGANGHFYKVEIRSNGVQYWRQCGKNAGGANCRFIGPARDRKQ